MIMQTEVIDYIKFGILSPDDAKRISVTKLSVPDTYNEDGYPIEGGLLDQKLGVIDPGLICKTCGARAKSCPGHFGRIDLVRPVIHSEFSKIIYMILQSTCRNCHRILLSDDHISVIAGKMKDIVEVDDEAIEDDGVYERGSAGILKKLKNMKKCERCGTAKGKLKFSAPTYFYVDDYKLKPDEIRDLLSKISNEDLQILGIDGAVSRPEWLILSVLLVPPVNVRPSITLESGERSEDDLTHKLVDVMRINLRLEQNRDMGAPQLVVEDLWELLQYHVTTYFDNQTSGIPPARHRSGRPLKTLAQRLKGKDGRFRSNLSGKRVNFSARTVISPDPLLSINEVGIPAEVARGLTVPLQVTAHSQEVAKELVKRGPTPPPDADGRYRCGVNYLVREDGQRIKVMEKNAEACAELVMPGSIVERQLIDGDIVLFNRQPSLHRMSMMAHFVRILPNKTFRFNLCDCPPYNADFDGDEMNLHVLQSQEARAEAKVVMKVEEHILSPRYGGPIIGMLHDHITAAFLLTYQNPKFTRGEVTYLLSKLRFPLPPPAGTDKEGNDYWTGKQLFSLTLPKDLSIEFR